MEVDFSTILDLVFVMSYGYVILLNAPLPPCFSFTQVTVFLTHLKSLGALRASAPIVIQELVPSVLWHNLSLRPQCFLCSSRRQFEQTED